MSTSDSMTITLRSFVLPPGHDDDFPVGQPLPFHVSPGISLEKLLEDLFAERVNRIGMVTVNGKKAVGDVVLKEGDRVDVYELLGGG